MIAVEALKAQIESQIHGAKIDIVPNDSPAAQPSFCVDAAHALAVALYLRDTPTLLLDFASNATGVDWPDRVEKSKVRVKKLVEGVEKEVEETVEVHRPGFLEAVYHLYSMKLGHGPVIIRMRTKNRTDSVHLPALTPVWKSCEFQEREIFDLYGIRFDGHPDLRRLLMWDAFEGHPMRKDYQEPDDYEYEPTAHDEILEKVTRTEQPVSGAVKKLT